MKKLKPISEASYEVFIESMCEIGYSWNAYTGDHIGIDDCEMSSAVTYKNRCSTIAAWKKFAKINGITNFIIKNKRIVP